MFRKVLVANRGEIAVRVMRTCKAMGIQTVAVYSEADKNAYHVRHADESYCIGPAPALSSYLNIDVLISAARQAGAEAIHPGYGFLSENADFAEACRKAGIVFVGPTPDAMRLMGSKVAAKGSAIKADVPCVPGYMGSDQQEDIMLKEAQKMGFPVLIKASAGGGGKGMRAVHQEDAFIESLAAAKREAKAAFGDDSVFLEKLLVKPRHIEFQIMADTHGNTVYFSERECSIQRRHQKVLEESPSIAVSESLRRKMGEAAVRVARSAGYVNAGTVEFMLDQDGSFYFLEMNTRLQVEHPVTEMVHNNIDLVKVQLEIASGEHLGIKQEDIRPKGHALEVRLYAEDPENDYLPSSGTVNLFKIPSGLNIRVDAGIETGDTVPVFYDPMLAKIITYGDSRSESVKAMQHALRNTMLSGIKTNLPLLRSIVENKDFQQGDLHTGFLAEHPDMLEHHQMELPHEVVFAYVMAKANGTHQNHDANPWKSLGPWRTDGRYEVRFLFGDKEYEIALRRSLTKHEEWEGTNLLSLDELRWVPLTCTYIGNGKIQLQLEGDESTEITIEETGAFTLLNFHDQTWLLEQMQPPVSESSAYASVAGGAQRAITAPMTGTIIKVLVKEGEEVDARQTLAVLGAMKMEHAIIAPAPGSIQKVYCQEGLTVQGGAVLIEMGKAANAVMEVVQEKAKA